MRRFILLGIAGVLLLARPALALDALATVSQAEHGENQPALPTGINLGFVKEPGPDSPGWPGGTPPTAADIAAMSGQTFTIGSDGSFQPWNCDGCAADLAKNASSKSISSAPLSGVELAAAGNLPAATNGTVMTAADAAAIEASKQPGVLSRPFTWMNEKTVGAVQTGMTAQIEHMQQFTAKFLPWWLQFAVIGIGLAALFGGGGHGKAEKFVASVMIVMISVSVGSQMYQKIAIDPVIGLPGVWQQYIVNAFGVISSDKPDAMMDAVFAGASAMEQRIMKAAPTGISNFGDRAELAIKLGVGHYLIVFSLGCMWVSKAALTFASMIGLEIGPLLIPFILFEATKFVFWNWVWLLVSALFGKLIVDLILGMYAGVMAKLLLSASITGNPATDGPGFVSMVIIMLVLGGSTLAMGAVGTIVFGHRMHANMAAAGYYMSAGPLRRMMAQTARGAI